MNIPGLTKEESSVYANDFFLFCNIWLKLFFYPPQERALRAAFRSGKKNIIFRYGRQAGKDYIASAYLVWFCIFHDNSRVVIASPSQTQSDIVLEYCGKWIGQSPTLRSMARLLAIRKIEFTNGSKIVSLPMGKGRTVRGHPASLILVSEAAHIYPGELINEVILPMGTHFNAPILMTSTPMGKNHFYNYCKADNYFDTHVTTEDIADYSKKVREYLTNDILPVMPRSSPRYRREILAEFDIDETQVFAKYLPTFFDVSMSFIESGVEGRVYVMGVDVAKYRDTTVICIIDTTDEEHLRVVHLEELMTPEERDWVYVRNRIVTLCKMFDIRKCLVDTTSGAGDATVDFLDNSLASEGLGTIVEGYTFHHPKNIDLVDNALICLDQKKVVSPYHQRLEMEMLDYQKTATKAGHLRYDHSSEGSSDRVDALLLALWAAQSEDLPLEFSAVKHPSSPEVSVMNYNRFSNPSDARVQEFFGRDDDSE